MASQVEFAKHVEVLKAEVQLVELETVNIKEETKLVRSETHRLETKKAELKQCLAGGSNNSWNVEAKLKHEEFEHARLVAAYSATINDLQENLAAAAQERDLLEQRLKRVLQTITAVRETRSKKVETIAMTGADVVEASSSTPPRGSPLDMSLVPSSPPKPAQHRIDMAGIPLTFADAWGEATAATSSAVTPPAPLVSALPSTPPSPSPYRRGDRIQRIQHSVDSAGIGGQAYTASYAAASASINVSYPSTPNAAAPTMQGDGGVGVPTTGSVSTCYDLVRPPLRTVVDVPPTSKAETVSAIGRRSKLGTPGLLNIGVPVSALG